MINIHPVPSRRLTASMVSLKMLRYQATELTRWWRQRPTAATESHRLSLALQGGGAHGAFTWGVLDALLEQPTVDFDALSGSSAGAINAVVMTHGWIEGGRQGARQALSEFWLDVGKQIPPMMTTGNGESISLTAATKMLANWVGLFSPSNLNPLAINPLRDVLSRQVNFERIRASSPFDLFVAATQANTGKLRLFREHELTIEMVLASACLPKIHRTVEIDGEPFWDGGFSANPAIFPLVRNGKSNDILLVLLAPHQHDDTPESMEAIESRVQDLGFKTHFLREMNAYARQLNNSKSLDGLGNVTGQDLNGTRFHMIDSNVDVLQRSETKMLAYTPFLEMLRDKGREQADLWLSQHSASIGKRSSVDLKQWLN